LPGLFFFAAAFVLKVLRRDFFADADDLPDHF